MNQSHYVLLEHDIWWEWGFKMFPPDTYRVWIFHSRQIEDLI